MRPAGLDKTNTTTNTRHSTTPCLAFATSGQDDGSLLSRCFSTLRLISSRSPMSVALELSGASASASLPDPLRSRSRFSRSSASAIWRLTSASSR